MLKIRILFFVTAVIYSFNIYALKGDETKPIQIEANHATADQKTMSTEFTGNIVMTRGSIIVHANQADAHQDKDNNRTIHLVGTPVTFEQLNDDNTKTTGQCNDFVYTTKNNLAVLSGRARVKKGDNEVIGDKLTYNTQTQVYSANSTLANGVSQQKAGRVTVILQPNQNNKDNNKNGF